jgi:hypothetical protein
MHRLFLLLVLLVYTGYSMPDWVNQSILKNQNTIVSSESTTGSLF